MLRQFEASGVISDWLVCASQQSFTGHIKGIYRQGIYVQDLNPPNQLIYLCSDKVPYLSVNGFRLEGCPWEEFVRGLQNDQMVFLKDRQLSIYTRGGVSRVVFHRLDTLTMQLPSRLGSFYKQRLRTLLVQEKLYKHCGLEDKDIEDLKKIQHISPESLENFLLDLIGKGRGLTPAGDDILFGYLAAKRMAGEGCENLHSLVQVIGQNSTPVSEQFFKALAEGFVSEALWRLSYLDDVEIEQEKLLDYFYHYGHSSGYDMLLGLSLYLDGGTIDE